MNRWRHGLVVFGIGCFQTLPESTADPSPIAMDEAACSVCGMLVAEQPSPRGQVVYKNGRHHHLCSLSELRAEVQNASPFGEPIAVYVEALPNDFDPTRMETHELPWIAANEAHYVGGVSRPRVMGIPLLSYAEEDVAQDVAARLGAKPISWQAVVDTPFSVAP